MRAEWLFGCLCPSSFFFYLSLHIPAKVGIEMSNLDIQVKMSGSRSIFFSFFTHLNNFRAAYFIEPFIIFYHVCYFEVHLSASGPGLEEAMLQWLTSFSLSLSLASGV